MHNLTGQSIGRYHILEPLGEGGMATVYKALDTRLENEVAVKVIRTERFTPEVLERSLKRFEREAKALARLTHANIVKVIDYGEYENSPYLVMPYLPGGTLKQLIRKRGRLPWREALRILLPIARALDYTHRLNVIHRDVKPSNILITDSGDPLLTDFGVAKIIEEELTFDLTATSATVGTPEYMAPEQASSKNVDHRADLYALGVVLYEMLTGRRPYEGDTPLAVIIKHASEPLPRPTRFAPDVPEKIEYILLKALAKKPEDRYADMAAFAEALEGALGVAAQPGPDTGRPDRPKFQPGSLLRWGMVLGGVLMVAILGFFGWQALVVSPAVVEVTAVPVTPDVQPIPTEMVLIPAGSFLMGTREGLEDEQPVHEVSLAAYWIDTYEVTNGEYKICVQDGACEPPLQDKSRSITGYYSDDQYADYPMIYVTWDMARTYCEWRGARLPTEAQWEKAARGTDQRQFPWGGVFGCEQANANGCKQDVVPVGGFSQGASPYGVLDMAGNVSEWTADYYGDYPAIAQTNPTGPTRGEYRVVRGGSYTQSYSEVRTTRRVFIREDVSFFYLGFRCAMSDD